MLYPLLNQLKIFYSIVLIILFNRHYIYAQEEGEEVKILVNLPDRPLSIDLEEWKTSYENLINSYLAETNKNNIVLNDVKVSFYFMELNPINSTSYSYYNYDYYYNIFDIINYLHDGIFDMVILDDRSMLNEIAPFEDQYFEVYYYYRKPTIGLFMNIYDYTEKSNLEFHDPRFLKDASYEGGLYGLPFEMDFSLLYYNSDNEKSNEIVEKMNSLTWDDLIKSLKEENNPTYPMNIALGYDDNALNVLMEYTNNYYNLSEEFDPNYFKLFYNKTSEVLFNSFHRFVSSCTNNNTESSIYLNSGEAFLNFINGESSFFYGKASQNTFFNSLPNISSVLPPKFISTVSEKYLAINNNSEINPNILLRLALQLTSKDFQLFKAKHFGSIPTFDFTKKNKDNDIKQYCENNLELCQTIENMQRIYIRDVFRTKKCAPYFQIQSFLPNIIRNFLVEKDISEIVSAFRNNDELITDSVGVYGIVVYIITIIFIIISIIIIVYTFIHRNHPYLRVISPMFCIMILIGCIMSVVRYLFDLMPFYPGKGRICQLFFSLSTSLIYIPMFAVTYRIYRIYKSTSYISRTLSNSFLYIVVAVLISVLFLYNVILTITCEYYYISIGNINSARYPIWIYTNYGLHNYIQNIYLYIIFVALLFLIISAGNYSKNFGDICYTFVVFILNINDFIMGILMSALSYKYFKVGFLLIMTYSCISALFCMYLLVGSRLIFILTINEFNSNRFTRMKMDDLKDFIPLKFNKHQYMDLIKKFKKKRRTFFNSKSNINRTSKNEFENNNNNNYAESTCSDNNKSDSSCPRSNDKLLYNESYFMQY